MKTWLIIFTLAMTSCASTDHHSSEILYKQYQEYKTLIASDYESALKTKVSEEYLETINEAEKNIPPEFITPFWKNLANKIKTEHSHFEEIDGKTGCLTINGLDGIDRIKSLSLYYIEENGHWVFDYVMIAAHDSMSDYYTQPECPNVEQEKI